MNPLTVTCQNKYIHTYHKCIVCKQTAMRPPAATPCVRPWEAYLNDYDESHIGVIVLSHTGLIKRLA